MASTEETIITTGRSGRQYVKDIWQYRELLFFLAWRDILVRYKQTVVGVSWALLRPILTVMVLTLVFNKFGRLASGDVPYPLLVLSGVLPWQFFATALSDTGNSLVANTHLISKVYFPRLLIPAGSLASSFLDLLVSMLLLLALFAWYSWVPPAQVLFLPLFFLLSVIAAFGAGVWAAALIVKYRDFRFIIPFAIQFGLYLSPVGFSSSVVPLRYQTLYSLNPMVGVIDGFRWCLLGGSHQLQWHAIAPSILISLVIFVTGILYFRGTEKTFADVI